MKERTAGRCHPSEIVIEGQRVGQRPRAGVELRTCSTVRSKSERLITAERDDARQKLGYYACHAFPDLIHPLQDGPSLPPAPSLVTLLSRRRSSITAPTSAGRTATVTSPRRSTIPATSSPSSTLHLPQPIWVDRHLASSSPSSTHRGGVRGRTPPPALATRKVGRRRAVIPHDTPALVRHVRGRRARARIGAGAGPLGRRGAAVATSAAGAATVSLPARGGRVAPRPGAGARTAAAAADRAAVVPPAPDRRPGAGV